MQIFMRPRPESDRCKRFCRPLLEPLSHEAYLANFSTNLTSLLFLIKIKPVLKILVTVFFILTVFLLSPNEVSAVQKRVEVNLSTPNAALIYNWIEMNTTITTYGVTPKS